jgi:hypothetical protein
MLKDTIDTTGKTKETSHLNRLYWQYADLASKTIRSTYQREFKKIDATASLE